MIALSTTTCKIAPTLDAAFDYASTLSKPANIIPTEAGYVIVENVLPAKARRKTITNAEVKRVRANAKKVFCQETGKTYLSLREAALETGASYQNISAVLHGRLHSTNKLHFQYADELDEIATNGEDEY